MLLSATPRLFTVEDGMTGRPEIGDWRRWHQIWQGLDTVNCGVAKCELH